MTSRPHGQQSSARSARRRRTFRCRYHRRHDRRNSYVMSSSIQCIQPAGSQPCGKDPLTATVSSRYAQAAVAARGRRAIACWLMAPRAGGRFERNCLAVKRKTCLHFARAKMVRIGKLWRLQVTHLIVWDMSVDPIERNLSVSTLALRRRRPQNFRARQPFWPGIMFRSFFVGPAGKWV